MGSLQIVDNTRKEICRGSTCGAGSLPRNLPSRHLRAPQSHRDRAHPRRLDAPDLAGLEWLTRLRVSAHHPQPDLSGLGGSRCSFRRLVSASQSELSEQSRARETCTALGVHAQNKALPSARVAWCPSKPRGAATASGNDGRGSAMTRAGEPAQEREAGKAWGDRWMRWRQLGSRAPRDCYRAGRRLLALTRCRCARYVSAWRRWLGGCSAPALRSERKPSTRGPRKGGGVLRGCSRDGDPRADASLRAALGRGRRNLAASQRASAVAGREMATEECWTPRDAPQGHPEAYGPWSDWRLGTVSGGDHDRTPPCVVCARTGLAVVLEMRTSPIQHRATAALT